MHPVQQTLRVAGLPSLTQQSDVEDFFVDRVKRKYGRRIVESVGPICDHSSRMTKRTTISFSSHKTAQRALDLELANRRFVAERGGREDVALDSTFLDLTTLHSADNPVTGKPDIDIVALHGLAGHAWNSFTTSKTVDQAGKRTRETNWLRDILPRLLEQDTLGAVYSRVMTYGYDADVWMTRSVADMNVQVNNLLSYLDTERRQDPQRPLFFIGHSLGGLVAKQAIVELANEAMRKEIAEDTPTAEEYNFPVKGCMFFGVPNRGSEVADTASGILKLLNTVFSVNRNYVHDLKSKSQLLANIASEFRMIRNTHDIQVISFYETVEYNRALGIIVDQDSAVIRYDGCPLPFGINRNHKEMAKFPDDDAHALEPAMQFLAKLAREAMAMQFSRSRTLSPPPPPPPVDNNQQPIGEDKYSTLESYDTVFLVDDSPSMAGPRWGLVKKILDYATTVATRYDPDGIDIHFFNNQTSNMDNVKDSAIARQVHKDIVLRGRTPTLNRLSQHLNHYMHGFSDNRRTLVYKGYNLIILTDGEPDPEWEDPDDISDRDDARLNPPAYRLIRKKLVKVAKALDEAGAERNQVGIQFCQIGNDDGARKLFKYLDDRLKGKYNLDRDMVDTVRCVSDADLTEAFFEKLLLGAIDKYQDHEDIQILEARIDQRSGARPQRNLEVAAHRQSEHQLSLPHRPHDGGKGKGRASSGEDIGIGPSSGQSQSDPQVPTFQSLTAAQQSGYGLAENHYEMQPNPTAGSGREQPQRRGLSSRVGSFPVNPSGTPTPGINRSSTVGEVAPTKKGFFVRKR